MIPAFNYAEICREISRYDTNEIKMMGLLFARPTSPLAKAEIIDNLDYFHHRSGKHIDFFCGGYGGYWEGRMEEFPDQIVVAPGQYTNWLFSAEKFNSFRAEIEAGTTWKYSGGVDLILANAHVGSKEDDTYIDFSEAVLCQLDQMKNENAILSVETFFEEIFRYAESQNADDPSWGFSDAKGKDIAGSAIKKLVFSLLPKKLGDEVNKAMHFAVVDIGKAA